MLHTPYDKTDRRYSEIADYFVPKGYNVVLIDLRDRYRSYASGVYYHAATPHTGRDGADICDWIGAQPWCNGNVGMWGISYGGFTSIQVSKLRPPHLRAILPMYATDDRYRDAVLAEAQWEESRGIGAIP
jgi:putative CocE/NonD family hydrolase